ncbi:MAG TPA: copper amine oxidase [Patescibacteria group bacterium]|nr:copper amine oxidase [Patescibacteria group bacterium]
MGMEWVKKKKPWLRLLLAGLLTVGVLADDGIVWAASPAAANTLLNKVRILELPEWPVSVNRHGGHLLLSDSPEMVNSDGITYEDTVGGQIRLFFHHVNNTNQMKKVVVVLTNDAATPAQVMIHRRGLSGQGRENDWMYVGTKVQQRYLENNEPELLSVPAQGATLLDVAMDQMPLGPGELINGMYDFTSDKPVKVSVVMMPLRANALRFAASASVLLPDEYRLRGTFDKPDRIVFPQARFESGGLGAVAMTLADHELDKYIEGVDATDGSKVVNYGNYGVIYRIYIPPMSGNGAYVFLNPRGGTYSGYVGYSINHEPETAVPTPEYYTGAFGERPERDFAYIAQLKRGQSMWLTFSPPGASNLPVKLVFVAAQPTLAAHQEE